MQLGRCPNCHSRVALEQVAQDESGRELLKILSTLDAAVGSALTAYVGLFRSEKRDLANDRAIKLMGEVLELGTPAALHHALVETVESLRSKRAAGSDTRALTNHNYLKRVLESMPASAGVTVLPHQPGTGMTSAPAQFSPTSKTGQALVALEGLKDE
jgi:hypothetical protein